MQMAREKSMSEHDVPRSFLVKRLPGTVSLRQFLIDSCGVTRTRLEQIQTSLDTFSEFLTSTLVSVESAVSVPPRVVPCEQRISEVLKSIIDRVYQGPNTSGAARRNVLCTGFCDRSFSYQITFLRQVSTSSSIEYICQSKPWAHLLEHLGEMVFEILMLCARVFVTSTECSDSQVYVQICGSPVEKSLTSAVSKTPSTSGASSSANEQLRLVLNSTIARSRIFYKRSPKEFRLDLGLSGRKLTISIFMLPPKSRRIPKRFREIQRDLEVFLKRHSHCPYRKLLHSICPVDELGRPASESVDSQQSECQSLLNANTPRKEVYLWLRAAIKRNIPKRVFGTSKNLDVVLRNVLEFVNLRRHETVSVGSLISGIKTNDIPWLKSRNRSDLATRQRMLALLVRWMFDEYIVPLVFKAFYVTESEPFKYQTMYYRHPIWTRIQKASMATLFESQFTLLDKTTARDLLASRSAVPRLGFGRLRFLPKKSGTTRPIVNLSRRSAIPAALVPSSMSLSKRIGDWQGKSGTTRPIVNLSRRSTIPAALVSSSMSLSSRLSKFLPVNVVMRSCLDVLRYEQERHGMLGATCQGEVDYFRVLLPFLKSVRQSPPGAHRGANQNRSPRIYVVSLDVQRCFDAIPVPRLLSLVDCLLKDEEDYIVQKYLVLSPERNDVRRRYKRFADAIYPRFQKLVDFEASKLHSAVLRDQGAQFVTQKRVASLVREHLSASIVQVPLPLSAIMLKTVRDAKTGRIVGPRALLLGSIVQVAGRFAKQDVGIPQGSVLSTLLCNLFLASIERDAFPKLCGGGRRDGSTSSSNRRLPQKKDHAERKSGLSRGGPVLASPITKFDISTTGNTSRSTVAASRKRRQRCAAVGDPPVPVSSPKRRKVLPIVEGGEPPVPPTAPAPLTQTAPPMPTPLTHTAVSQNTPRCRSFTGFTMRRNACLNFVPVSSSPLVRTSKPPLDAPRDRETVPNYPLAGFSPLVRTSKPPLDAPGDHIAIPDYAPVSSSPLASTSKPPLDTPGHRSPIPDDAPVAPSPPMRRTSTPAAHGAAAGELSNPHRKSHKRKYHQCASRSLHLTPRGIKRKRTHHRALLRHVDDFLFLSTSKSECRHFVRRIHSRNKGQVDMKSNVILHVDDFLPSWLEDANVSINVAKTQSNFSFDHRGAKIEASDSGFVHWCGLLLGSPSGGTPERQQPAKKRRTDSQKGTETGSGSGGSSSVLSRQSFHGGESPSGTSFGTLAFTPTSELTDGPPSSRTPLASALKGKGRNAPSERVDRSHLSKSRSPLASRSHSPKTRFPMPCSRPSKIRPPASTFHSSKARKVSFLLSETKSAEPHETPPVSGSGAIVGTSGNGNSTGGSVSTSGSGNNTSGSTSSTNTGSTGNTSGSGNRASDFQVRRDYSRNAGVQMRDAMEVRARLPGACVRRKLIRFLRLKISPILIDSQVNTPFVVALNVYQAFLDIVIRFHCLQKTLRSPSDAFLKECINEIVFRFHPLSLSKIKAIQTEFSFACFPLSKTQTIWLGFHACHRILARKQTRLRSLVSWTSLQLESTRTRLCAGFDRASYDLVHSAATERSAYAAFEAVLF